MFLHLLCFRAFDYVVLYDKEERQLGSGDKFKTVEQQIMYHLLLEYMSSFEKAGFLNIVQELIGFIEEHDHAQQPALSPLAIKEKMARGILAKFSLGEYKPKYV